MSSCESLTLFKQSPHNLTVISLSTRELRYEYGSVLHLVHLHKKHFVILFLSKPSFQLPQSDVVHHNPPDDRKQGCVNQNRVVVCHFFLGWHLTHLHLLFLTTPLFLSQICIDAQIDNLVVSLVLTSDIRKPLVRAIVNLKLFWHRALMMLLFRCVH